MTRQTPCPPWEPSAWMREAIARRTARLDALGVAERGCVAVAPLVGDWSGVASTREDRTCDRCRVYVPRGRDLWVGAVQMRHVDGTLAALAFGLCAFCRSAKVAA